MRRGALLVEQATLKEKGATLIPNEGEEREGMDGSNKEAKLP